MMRYVTHSLFAVVAVTFTTTAFRTSIFRDGTTLFPLQRKMFDWRRGTSPHIFGTQREMISSNNNSWCADNGKKNVCTSSSSRSSRTATRTVLYSWLKDAMNGIGLDFAQEKEDFNRNTLFENNDKSKKLAGVVIRTAAKSYNAATSTPSSRLYTTKKHAKGQVHVSAQGVDGDHNHYRTNALKGTPNRAVSILTTDALQQLKQAGYPLVQEGDLGENLYVDGIDFRFFQIGKRYRFAAANNDGGEENPDQNDVIVEITERIEPCGNLCKLPYISDETLKPLQRLDKCKKFLLWLDRIDGLRGWYGKIIGGGGVVKVGDQVTALGAAH